MANDKFRTNSDTAGAPAREAYAITPHNTNELATVTKRIFVGIGGNVTLRAVGSDADVTYYNCADGSYLHVCAVAVRATGTDATNLIAEA